MSSYPALPDDIAGQNKTTSVIAAHKVIRNTYLLLSMTLFVAIFNLFTSLLQLLGFSNGND